MAEWDLRGGGTGVWVGAMFVALAGCGEPGVGDGTWAGTVDTLPDGVVHVSNPAEGLWGEDEEWRLVEDLRIGAVDGDGPEVFGEIRDLVVDDAGRIHVLDGQAHEVRVFDADGGHVNTVGGQGQGPGELENPGGLTLDPEGRLWVLDGGNGRFSVFEADGAFAETLRREGPPTINLQWRGRFVEDGSLLDPAALMEGGVGLVRRGLGGEPTDTLVLEPFEPERRAVEDEENPSLRWPVPFQPEHTWTVDPDGFLWWGVNDRFRFVQGSLTGDTVWVIERDHEPDPVTVEDREAVLEVFREQADRMGAGGAPLEAADFPEEKPAYSRILPDDRGHVWVIPFHLPLGPADRARVDRLHVFDPDGRYLGEARSETPVAPHPVVFREGRLYGVTADELGVEYVVRLRVEVGPGNGPSL